MERIGQGQILKYGEIRTIKAKVAVTVLNTERSITLHLAFILPRPNKKSENLFVL